MPSALKNPTVDQSCLEFFGLERPPFARLPDTSSAFRAEQHVLLEAHLASTMTETDRLLVLRGADGAGKTTVLQRFLRGLGPDALVALIDETCTDGTDFYCTFLQQMGFQDINGKLNELRTITREFLVHRAGAGDPVLLVLDNAPRIRPAVLEQLRWITGIRRDNRRVLSVVMAGSSELDRILESPAMSGLRFQNTVNFHIRAFTAEETTAYIRHRLQLAGGSNDIEFTDKACEVLHRYAGGLPRATNRVGSLLLAEAATRETHTIDDALVREVARAEELPVNVYPLKSRGRRKSDAGGGLELPEADMADLANRVAELSAKVDELEFEKGEADELLASQNIDVRDLRESLAAQTQEADELAKNVRDGVREISRLRKQLDNNEKSLRRSADDAKKLASQLKEEKRAVRSARNDADRAQRRVEKLEGVKSGLQEKITELRSELRAAKKKARQLTKAEIALEKSEAKCEELLESASRLEDMQAEIDARDAMIEELEARLAALAQEDTQARTQLETVPEPVAAKDEAGRQAATDPIVALEVMRNGEIEQVFEIDAENTRIMIGRGEDSDLLLQSDFVSRHHALLFCKPWQTHVEDLNSFNGTIVNGQKVSRCRLQPDDTLIIGDYSIRARALRE